MANNGNRLASQPEWQKMAGRTTAKNLTRPYLTLLDLIGETVAALQQKIAIKGEARCH